MSSVVDVQKTEAYLQACSRLLEFRNPQVNTSMSFKSCFKSSMDAEDANQLITETEDSRLQMINDFSVNATYDTKIRSLEAYLGHLLRLEESIRTAKEAVKLDKEMHFEWRGSLTDKLDCTKSSDIIYEVCMVLHTKAILHNNAANSLLATDPTSFATDAGKHMLEASSIMHHMSTNIASGSWKLVISKKIPNPPELCEHVCAGLAALFKAQAQALSFVKISGGTGGAGPPAIKSRLCVGVVNSLTASTDAFFRAPGAPLAYQVQLTHVHILKQIYTALAYQLQAQVYLEKKEVGNAIAYCAVAKEKLVEQKKTVKLVWTEKGLPKFAHPYVYLRLASAYLNEAIDLVHKEADQDNRFVYFQQVPAAHEMPLLPQEASVMNPPAFKDPPRAGPVAFVYVAQKTVFTSMFSGFMGSMSSSSAANTKPSAEEGGAASGAAPLATADDVPPPASAPPASASDEAYARQLQRQFDADPPPPGADPPPPSAAKYNSLV
mmetsp:Transcript_29104/g.59621  ORF Transcript_29104/g.59621 Transcript_29104/m.59621 type:complete len:493 (-) Transcript_29104:64-1542(-)|eukprot:CAMPEP_0181299726 /NCGR_PEP_ID=MMETSP1101-20121128/6503_1 /TAXON_ID=46948 /ORGANISM="Rhodomonas abbreviata, Strain Caron Lab Isolate" /LENGTH=492 /DNA_ID=CAMNT_0023404901 /DNA_START=116 /DNA_END=1594 /DNA_ORIENTATION=+